MKIDKTLDPIRVAPLRVDRVVMQPHHVAHLVEQPRLWPAGPLGLLWTFWALPATLFVMISHRLIHIFSHESWTFRPDIRPSNIRAKLPENHANILLSGQNAPSII